MRLFRSHWPLLALFLALATLRPAAAQTVIYDTFGPSNGTGGSGFQVNSELMTAAPFNSGSTRRQFSAVDLKLRYISGPNTVQVKLMSHAVDRPGTVLETMTVLTSPIEFTDTLVTATSATNPVLEANTQYWIALVAAGETKIVPLIAPGDVRGTSFGDPTTGTWDAAGDIADTAMRVYAGDEVPISTDAVPEPGAAVLFLPALAALALLHRRRSGSA